MRAGDAALVVAAVGGRIEATGTWRRGPRPFFAHCADLEKIVVHPGARGTGLGRQVTAALLDHARGAGIETVTLGVRGTNRGAIALYRQLGFREWGRLPDVIEVGNERFDDVRMFVQLGRGPDVVLRGSQAG